MVITEMSMIQAGASLVPILNRRVERDICIAGGPSGELVYDNSTVNNLLQELVHISLTNDPLPPQASFFADPLIISV